MKESPRNEAQIIDIYRRRAKGYDTSGISGLQAWRSKAVKALNLELGDLVVDIGCGTGLNFSLLHEAVGSQGKIIGVDVTDAMLAQARQRITEHEWNNIELVQSDAAQYQFPPLVDGIIATFSLTFVPDLTIIIQNGSKTLKFGGSWVVLDMAWPTGVPLWLRHTLFFLPSWGITINVLRRKPWKTIWHTMEENLTQLGRQSFGLGFFYLAYGKKAY